MGKENKKVVNESAKKIDYYRFITPAIAIFSVIAILILLFANYISYDYSIGSTSDKVTYHVANGLDVLSMNGEVFKFTFLGVTVIDMLMVIAYDFLIIELLVQVFYAIFEFGEYQRFIVKRYTVFCVINVLLGLFIFFISFFSYSTDFGTLWIFFIPFAIMCLCLVGSIIALVKFKDEKTSYETFIPSKKIKPLKEFFAGNPSVWIVILEVIAILLIYVPVLIEFSFVS